MIKNIVFDMGNVLLEWNPDKIIGRFTDDAERIQKLKEAVFEQEYWSKLDAGTATEEEAREHAKSLLPEEYHEDIDEIMDNWQYCMPIISDTSNLVKYLHAKGYGVYLLSNANRKFVEVKRDLHCLRFMDGYLVSYEVGCVKPNPEIYQKFFEKFDLNPEECLFIDDLQANCDGSEKMGMKAYCYDGDYEKLLAYLKENGIEI
ncbi:MAG: HAD family phosphatase [Candidatus Gastranaerophilales bacterium]|nr:HAD family phosphatase [Candidatus Gastranaerophilales bacterium]